MTTTPVTSSPDPLRWAMRLARKSHPRGDCWIVRGVDGYGYGRFRWKDGSRTRYTTAHRAAWLAYRGDLPADLILDHTCRNRACCNPWHLEPVTVRENNQRADHSPKKGRSGQVRSVRHRCARHGRDDGYAYTTRAGHIRWVCRICERARKAEKTGRQTLPPVQRAA